MAVILMIYLLWECTVFCGDDVSLFVDPLDAFRLLKYRLPIFRTVHTQLTP